MSMCLRLSTCICWAMSFFVKRGKVKNHETPEKYPFPGMSTFLGSLLRKHVCFSIGRRDFLGTYRTKYFNILASELILDKPILFATFSPENSSQGPEIYRIREINSYCSETWTSSTLSRISTTGCGSCFSKDILTLPSLKYQQHRRKLMLRRLTFSGLSRLKHQDSVLQTIWEYPSRDFPKAQHFQVEWNIIPKKNRSSQFLGDVFLFAASVSP